MAKRDEYVREMEAVRERLETAGPCHKRDLMRQLHQMEKDIKTYDLYHCKARTARNGEGG